MVGDCNWCLSTGLLHSHERSRNSLSSCFVNESVQEKSIAGLRGFVGIIVGGLLGGREKGGGEVLRVGAGAVGSCKRDKKGGVDGRWGRSRLLKKKWEEKLILI